MPTAPSTFRIGQFARIAGVTIRALHHYDRVGLLRPTRGNAGYRVYTERDLERLEQIVVLKFLGVPLKQIAVLLRARPQVLATSLLAQRRTLEEKRQLLDRAIAAIRDLETAVAAGTEAPPQLFKRIIEVIDMHNDSDTFKENYDSLISQKVERLRATSPEVLADLRSQWGALLLEIRGVLTESPDTPAAQALGIRWTGLLSQLMGTPVDTKMLAGHQGAREWDPRMASFVDKPVWDFMTRVLAAGR